METQKQFKEMQKQWEKRQNEKEQQQKLLYERIKQLLSELNELNARAAPKSGKQQIGRHVVVESAVTSASEKQRSFAKLNLIVLQLSQQSNILCFEMSANVVIETSLMMLLIAYLRMRAISSLNQKS